MSLFTNAVPCSCKKNCGKKLKNKLYIYTKTNLKTKCTSEKVNSIKLYILIKWVKFKHRKCAFVDSTCELTTS